MTQTRYEPWPSVAVERPVMRMRWSSLTFLHWSYDVDVVQQLLPDGLTVEPYDGRAWVGLVPFQMMVAPPAGPGLPWLSHFPETNVRTYVRAHNGMTGIWFFSLDAARLAAVTAARGSWGLPYYWSSMGLGRQGDRLTYTCSRRRGQRPAASDVEIEAGEPIPDHEVTAFDHYLTARFVLFARHAGKLWYTRADHPRWPLRRAIVCSLSDGLVPAAGLPQPEDEPVVHFSDGVDVKVGLPHRVG